MEQTTANNILPNAQALISVTQTPTEARIYEEGFEGPDDLAPWGETNEYPKEVREKLELATIAPMVMYKLVQLQYGDGIKYYRRTFKDGKEGADFTPIPEIDAFFKRSNINRYFLETLVDYRYVMNTFNEYIFNNRKDKITRIGHLEAEFSRVSTQEKKTLLRPFLYYSAKWPSPASDDLVKIHLIDRKDPQKSIKRNKAKKMAYHTYFPSPGRTTYAMPFWGGLYRKDGWLDVSIDTPEIINAMHRNQITLKYHIQIPLDYWPARFPEWDKYQPTEKEKRIQETYKLMDEMLVGKQNQLKTFYSHFGVNQLTNKEIPGFKIDAIDDKVKKEQYIPNSQAADQQIVQTLGLDPSLVGLQPTGGKMGAGSGSDKRVSMLNAVALMPAEMQIVLEPLYIVAEFNNWGDDVVFAFPHQLPTRLDENSSGNETVV